MESKDTSTGTPSRRGFAAMNPEKQREIARKGGKAAHEKGKAHEFTPEEAREAGRKGGQTVSRNRQHMAEIGRVGGQARVSRRAAQRGEPVTGLENRTSSDTISSVLEGISFPIRREELVSRVGEREIEIGNDRRLVVRELLESSGSEEFRTPEEVSQELMRLAQDRDQAA